MKVAQVVQRLKEAFSFVSRVPVQSSIWSRPSPSENSMQNQIILCQLKGRVNQILILRRNYYSTDLSQIDEIWDVKEISWDSIFIMKPSKYEDRSSRTHSAHAWERIGKYHSAVQSVAEPWSQRATGMQATVTRELIWEWSSWDGGKKLSKCHRKTILVLRSTRYSGSFNFVNKWSTQEAPKGASVGVFRTRIRLSAVLMYIFRPDLTFNLVSMGNKGLN